MKEKKQKLNANIWARNKGRKKRERKAAGRLISFRYFIQPLLACPTPTDHNKKQKSNSPLC